MIHTKDLRSLVLLILVTGNPTKAPLRIGDTTTTQPQGTTIIVTTISSLAQTSFTAPTATTPGDAQTTTSISGDTTTKTRSTPDHSTTSAGITDSVATGSPTNATVPVTLGPATTTTAGAATQITDSGTTGDSGMITTSYRPTTTSSFATVDTDASTTGSITTIAPATTTTESASMLDVATESTSSVTTMNLTTTTATSMSVVTTQPTTLTTPYRDPACKSQHVQVRLNLSFKFHLIPSSGKNFAFHNALIGPKELPSLWGRWVQAESLLMMPPGKR